MDAREALANVLGDLRKLRDEYDHPHNSPWEEGCLDAYRRAVEIVEAQLAALLSPSDWTP